MDDGVPSQPCTPISSTVVVASPWMTVHKDLILSNGGAELEYWRITRSDSVVVLTRTDGGFVLPPPQFRPGVGERTLDFPGGRVDGEPPELAAARAVRRELQLSDAASPRLTPLSAHPFFVDSAASSQRLYGFVTELPPGIAAHGQRYSTPELLSELRCLQCRAMLLEWLSQEAGTGPPGHPGRRGDRP